ncbi:MAG: lysylphosphatidylglycerol synthase domain-containing protein [Bacteroidales bacterium]|nr:lysylphosphatidylglycerol synthase domain-containing protein [Bacteroidales bacterium]
MRKGKLYRTIDISVKTFIIISAFYFIYREIFYKHDFYTLFKNISEISLTKGYFISIVMFFMMLANWLIEAIKWKYLIRKLENISLLKSLQAIFSGITFSIFTPNRFGEFGGKVFYVEKQNQLKAFLITIIGSTAQLLTTIIVGIAGLFYFILKYSDLQSRVNSYVYYILIILMFITAITLVFLFLNTSSLKTLLNKIPKIRKFERIYSVFSLYNRIELMNVLLLSLCRYVVFSVQFYILLDFFNVTISLFDGLMMISLIYFVIAAIPTMALTEIGVRGSVSLYFLGMISVNIIGIVTASFSLWIINLALPALIGSIFVYNLKFYRKNS